MSILPNLRNVDDLQCFLFRHLSGKILVTCIGRLLQPCIILGIIQILTGGFLFVQCTLVSLVHSSLGTVKFFNDDFVLRIDFVFEPRRNFFAGFPLMDNAVTIKSFLFRLRNEESSAASTQSHIGVAVDEMQQEKPAVFFFRREIVP